MSASGYRIRMRAVERQQVVCGSSRYLRVTPNSSIADSAYPPHTCTLHTHHLPLPPCSLPPQHRLWALGAFDLRLWRRRRWATGRGGCCVPPDTAAPCLLPPVSQSAWYKEGLPTTLPFSNLTACSTLPAAPSTASHLQPTPAPRRRGRGLSRLGHHSASGAAAPRRCLRCPPHRCREVAAAPRVSVCSGREAGVACSNRR